MMSLSDRTKSFIVYSAVLVVAVCNIVFGLIWVNAPAPQTRPAAATAVNSPAAAGQTAPANADGMQTGGNDASVQIEEPIAPSAGEEAQPQCDVNACTAAYRTFRASDCTYMPSAGVRRICTK